MTQYCITDIPSEIFTLSLLLSDPLPSFFFISLFLFFSSPCLCLSRLGRFAEQTPRTSTHFQHYPVRPSLLASPLTPSAKPERLACDPYSSRSNHSTVVNFLSFFFSFSYFLAQTSKPSVYITHAAMGQHSCTVFHIQLRRRKRKMRRIGGRERAKLKPSSSTDKMSEDAEE